MTFCLTLYLDVDKAAALTEVAAYAALRALGDDINADRPAASSGPRGFWA